MSEHEAAEAAKPYVYSDRDGDELVVETVTYDGVPHAALGANSVHIHPDHAWDVCEAILAAAGVGGGS